MEQIIANLLVADNNVIQKVCKKHFFSFCCKFSELSTLQVSVFHFCNIAFLGLYWVFSFRFKMNHQQTRVFYIVIVVVMQIQAFLFRLFFLLRLTLIVSNYQIYIWCANKVNKEIFVSMCRKPGTVCRWWCQIIHRKLSSSSSLSILVLTHK